MKTFISILMTVVLLSSATFYNKAAAQTNNADTILRYSFDNFKGKPNYSPSYVLIKSKTSGKVLYENYTNQGKCLACYDKLIFKADSCYNKKNYADAAVLYTAAFTLNDNKGKVKHRLVAACCYATLNELDLAFENLNRVVFVAKFRNLQELSNNNCFKILQKDKRWPQLIEGVIKNLEGLESAIKRSY